MKCAICKIELTPSDVQAPTQDCGGDCLRCMAECNDPDCMVVMARLEPWNDQWRPDET